MIELIRQGGWMTGLIVATGLGGMVVFFERMLHYHRAQIRPVDFLEGIFNVLRRGNVVEAVSLCEETPGPVARVVRAALLQQDAGREALERAITEAGFTEVARIERRVRVLAVISRVTPLMGLLGTIIAFAGALFTIERHAPLVHIGDLAGPMAQALISSAAGLAVAIPAYAGYNVLVGRVESLLLDMEFATGEILAHLERRTAPRTPEVKP